MKLLLVGPYPPPHGGVSVHVAAARARLAGNGVPCRVLNLNREPAAQEYCIPAGGAAGFPAKLLWHAAAGWTLHVHTNGHNRKGWLVALAAGLAGVAGPASLLTLHSGMTPEFLARSARDSALARFTCRLFRRVICVSPAILEALAAVGVPPERLEIVPAYLPVDKAGGALDPAHESWIRSRKPFLSAALSFRPEYGFDFLAAAVLMLRRRHPEIGVAVMGTGEDRLKAEKLLADADLNASILLLGDVPHPVCLSVMARSDLFVRPTLADGDAISVREALALGVPVVASALGNRPEGTVLFEPGSAADLMDKVEYALKTAGPAQPAAGECARWNRLLEIYAQIAS